MNHSIKVVKAILDAPYVDSNGILYALQGDGCPVAKASEDFGCSCETVYFIVRGDCRSFDVATYIAAKLGTILRRLWGDAYSFTRKGNQQRVSNN